MINQGQTRQVTIRGKSKFSTEETLKTERCEIFLNLERNRKDSGHVIERWIFSILGQSLARTPRWSGLHCAVFLPSYPAS